VVLEPLTPLMPLTVDPLRQPAALVSLARVLMAVGVAGWGLVQRITRLPSNASAAQRADFWLRSCEKQRGLVSRLSF
jgi:hypothetical protein